jgi:hypothetical protein
MRQLRVWCLVVRWGGGRGGMYRGLWGVCGHTVQLLVGLIMSGKETYDVRIIG